MVDYKKWNLDEGQSRNSSFGNFKKKRINNKIQSTTNCSKKSVNNEKQLQEVQIVKVTDAVHVFFQKKAVFVLLKFYFLFLIAKYGTFERFKNPNVSDFRIPTQEDETMP